MSRNKFITNIIIVGMLLSACGYRFAGSGSFPAGIKKVFIVILKNRTAETGIENTITNDLRYEFIRYNRVVTRDKADAILSGEVKSSRVETISRRGVQTSQERRVTVSVDLQLTDSNGRVVWSVQGISANEAFDVVSDKQAAEQNRRAAISALSKRLAENVYYRLTENF
ncbi:LPS assembly lipoprotein LptE [Thermodesulfobacteriota bacterium]